MKRKEQIIIFIKNPEKGKVKTRLAKTIGDEKALEIYLKMVQKTVDEVNKSNAVSTIFFSEKILTDYHSDYRCIQEGNDLGEKMSNAFERSMKEASCPTLIIGTDCPQISVQIIEKAFSQLNTHDVVIGPAFDGGYYLLGMKKFHPELFLDMTWSTSFVLEETVKRLNQLKLKHYLLETLRDIDTEEDLVALPKDF